MALNYHFDTETFLAAWQQWKEWRKAELRLKYKSVIGEQMALTHLFNESDGTEENAILLINRSMGNGWRGFFRYKQPTSIQHTNSSTNNSKVSHNIQVMQAATEARRQQYEQRNNTSKLQ